MGDKRKSNHVKAIEAWEDKKRRAREQLTGYQAKGKNVDIWKNDPKKNV